MLEFLKAWLKWATEDGAPDRKPFNRRFGLCFEIVVWSKLPGNQGKVNTPRIALDCLFQQDGLCDVYPFGVGAYGRRLYEGTQHLDPNRLAWVRKTIEKLENEQNETI